MSNHTFTPGDSVIHEATETRGKITSTNNVSAVVSWEPTEGAAPPDILPVTDLVPAPAFTPGDRVSDTGNGRRGAVAADRAMVAEHPGMIPVHWDNGWRSCVAPSTLAPVAAGIEHVSTADLEAEIAKRGLTPPAGFTRDTTGTLAFIGPEHIEETWRVLSQWSFEAGVTYCIEHDGRGVWTPAEIESLPAAIESVRREIDLAAALEYMRKHPELTSKKVTIDRLCSAAQGEGIGWGAMAEAWTIFRDENKAAGK